MCRGIPIAYVSDQTGPVSCQTRPMSGQTRHTQFFKPFGPSQRWTIKPGTTLIRSSNGKIFTVRYVKSNGRSRRLNGRLGVTKGLTGKGLGFDASAYGVLPVFDLYANGYRMVNLDTLNQLTIEGSTYRVV